MKIKFIKASYEIDLLGETGLQKLKRIEKVARLCYKTGDRITDTSYEPLIRFLCEKKHEAMLEFADVAVKFTVNRAFTHELVRHRLASFAQESQRYVGYGEAIEFIIPSWTNIKPFEQDLDITDLFQINLTDAEKYWIDSNFEAAYNYRRLLDLGWRPEQARDVLPNATKTEIWIKTNCREWRHVFHLRDAAPAAPQMREMMGPLHIDFQNQIPILFEV